MEIKLHANATTTPRIRKYLQESTKSDRELATELGISVTTVRRWRQRENTDDRHTTPKLIHKALRQEQIILINALRDILQAPLDELLVMVAEGLGIALSRATLNRYLKPVHQQREAPALRGKQALKAGLRPRRLRVRYRLLALHMDDDGDHHLLWAQEPISGWCFARVYSGISPSLVAGWADEALNQCPADIQSVETDSGQWPGNGLRQRLAERGIDAVTTEGNGWGQAIIVPLPLAEIIPAARQATVDELATHLCTLFNCGKTQKKLGDMTPQAFLQALRQEETSR